MFRLTLPLPPRLRLALVVPLNALLLAACQGDCTGVAGDGIQVTVIDAATERPITGFATVTISDGDYVEVLKLDVFVPDQRLYVGAHERMGTYDVHVEVPGYESQSRSQVKVTRERKCGVIMPNRFTVALVPEPA